MARLLINSCGGAVVYCGQKGIAIGTRSRREIIICVGLLIIIVQFRLLFIFYGAALWIALVRF